VTGLGEVIYLLTHVRSGSYVFAAFSGIDLPDRINSPERWLKSTSGVFAVPLPNKSFNSFIGRDKMVESYCMKIKGVCELK
jgi:hypothetical protein